MVIRNKCYNKVDPKEEASVVEVFQDVLDKLSDVGEKGQAIEIL
jgi:hypothetical protein